MQTCRQTGNPSGLNFVSAVSISDLPVCADKIHVLELDPSSANPSGGNAWILGEEEVVL